MKNIKKLYRYLIPLTVITVMTFSSFTNAGAFFSDFMEKFIADGKVITVRIEEGIESPRIIPAADSRISRVEDNESVILEADHTYTMTLEKRKYNYYQIQVFATREKEKAGQIWKQLIDRGYPDVEIIEKDNLYKVRTGDFPDKKQAEIEASNLKEDGYTTWMVPAEKTLSTRIYIYNQKDEQIFSGEKLIFRGEARINQNLYRDKIVFSLDNLSSSKVLKIINTTPLDYVVTGIMENRLQQKGFSAGVLKAYAVILRTELLYKLYNREKEYFNLPEFKGIDCRQEIEEAVTATTGLILSDDSDPGTFFSYLDQNNFRDILVSKFKELKIIDLKEYVIEKTRVDAEIEWGLDYNEIYQLRWEGPGLITVLDLDLNKGSFAVEPVLPGNRVSRPGDLRQMVKDNNALAAVNGGYFNYNGPLGILVVDGVPVSEPLKNRTAMILTEENRVIFSRVDWDGILTFGKEGYSTSLDGINRDLRNNEIIYFNKFYDNTRPELKNEVIELVVENNKIMAINQPELPIPENGFVIRAHGEAVNFLEELDIKIGDRVTAEFNFKPDLTKLKVKHAVGAGPRLLKNGQIFINSREEEIQSDIAYGRAPRSAVGVTENNHLIFMTVDGRQPGTSIGFTLEELAAYMQEYGVKDAMNLDGGSSARMVVRGFIMNNPSGERLVGNGIIIKSLKGR